MLNFKKFLLILFLFLLIFFISRYENKKNFNKKNQYQQIKVGVLLPGSPSNKYSNSYYGYKALKKLEENYGIELTYNEYVTSKNITYLLNDYSHKGYNLIISQGEELEYAILKNSTNYSNITFACIEGKNGKENVSSYDLNYEELAFIAGIITAELNSENNIGLIEFDKIKSYKFFFEKGITTYNNNFKLIYQKINNLNKEYNDELAFLFKNNVNIVCLFFYSKIFEEFINEINSDMKILVIGGNEDQENNLKNLVRININYNIIYDKIYKDYIQGLRGQKIKLGFNNNIFSIKGESIIDDNINNLIIKNINNL